MKNIQKISFICLLAFLLVNCEDNEKSPLPAGQPGAFVLVDITSALIDVTQIETSGYGGTLQDTRGNIASHTFEVRSVIGTNASDFAPVYTATSFPADFSITAGDIATALGVDVSSFPPGTRFDLVGTSTTVDGDEIDFFDLNADLQAEIGMRQAYQLRTFISCPFNQADALGTYQVDDPRGFYLGTSGTFEVVAGDESNEIVMINPFGGNEAYDIVITVDAASGQATVAEQFAFSTLEQCCGGFEATRVVSQEAGGFVFSCAGVITLNLNTSITQIGTGGQFTFGALVYGGTKIGD